MRCCLYAGRWELSLEAVEAFLRSRKWLISEVYAHPTDGGARRLRLHFFHASLSRALRLLACQLASHSLAASGELQQVQEDFARKCAAWCGGCGAPQWSEQTPQARSLNALLEEETAFASLKRELNTFRRGRLTHFIAQDSPGVQIAHATQQTASKR